MPADDATRRRRRFNVTLGPVTVARLHARVLNAQACGYGSNFSREIDRAIDEAEHNLTTARHQVLGFVHPIRLQLHYVRQQLAAGRRVTHQDLQPIEDVLAKMTARLDPPPQPGTTTPAPAATPHAAGRSGSAAS